MGRFSLVSWSCILDASFRMKKILIIIAGIVVVAATAAAVYYFYLYEPPKRTRPTKDWSAMVVPPTKYSLRNETFVVPGAADQVVLSLVAPTATRDYPMGSFTLTGSSTKNGQLVALDFFTTELEAGVRAVPISVTYPGEEPMYYLAILSDDGTKKVHVASLPLGPSLQITSVTRSGNEVTINYAGHAFGQAKTETPSVGTTAIINIVDKTFVQEGRKPWLEVVESVKQFAGRYDWVRTIKSDDSEVVPSTLGTFNLEFDTNRITLGTDCNVGGMVFVPPTGSSTSLTFFEFTVTNRFCESEEEGPYFDMVKQVQSYSESVDGATLTFSLGDGSTMEFVRPGTVPATEEEDEGSADAPPAS
jgi:hypothetical protein